MRRFLVALALLPALALAADVNPAAKGGGKTTEVLVTTAASVAVPATPLTDRRYVEIQNLGPNAIFCTVDGTNPTSTKARRIEAATASASAAWVIQAGANIAVRCIAATADQVTGAATIVTELR